MPKTNFSIHSPANGLTEGFGVGGGSKPGEPSSHPDVNVSGVSSRGKAVNAEFGSIPNAPGDRSSVSVDEVQLVTGVPTEGAATSLGPTMAGGLGNPIRP